MTEETARLVHEIRTRSREVTSLVGAFEGVHDLQIMPLETRGRFYYLRPDKCRSESRTNKSEIVTVRNGSKVERRLPARREIWRYDLKDLPQALPLHYPIADFRDPFFAVDEDDLTYVGQQNVGDTLVQRFAAKPRSWSRGGMLDTRKGFSIPYQAKGLQMHMELSISAGSGLLRRLVGTDSTGKVVVQIDYHIEGIDVPLDGSLFALEQSGSTYRSIDITDTMFAALNPDAADGQPSVN